MMRDAEKTIGNMVDRSKLAFISYMDKEGFPVTKAMLAPRQRSVFGSRVIPCIIMKV